MARYHSGLYEQVAHDILDEVVIPVGSHEVEGGGVVWVANIDIRGTVDVITVLDYDQSRHGCYDKKFKPHVIIKNNQNCAQNNLLVRNFAGNLLFTFDTDDTVVPGYCVLRLNTARHWQLA